jgi:peptidyl-prolyl cis-trans isomerase SurA
VYTVDWLQYAARTKQRQGADFPPYAKAMHDFTVEIVTRYYSDHLNEWNADLSAQLTEFNEANLLFSVMDKHIWQPSNDDTAGVRSYFNQHPGKYNWLPGFSGVAVSAHTKELAQEVSLRLRQQAERWRAIINGYSGTVAADSSRYEYGQYQLRPENGIKKGYLSPPEKNTGDDSWVFVMVTRVFPSTIPKTFEEARGSVITDYQQVMEDKWLETYRARYPVKLNEAAWKELSR